MWREDQSLSGHGATWAAGPNDRRSRLPYRTICQWDQIVFLRNAKKMDLLWRLTGLSNERPPSSASRL